MAETLPDFMELILDLATEDFFRRYDEALAVIGDRPPWTRSMTAREKLDLWMQHQMGGPEGWAKFLQERLTEGMTPPQAFKSMSDFNVWGANQLQKDRIDAPQTMEMGNAYAA